MQLPIQIAPEPLRVNLLRLSLYCLLLVYLAAARMQVDFKLQWIYAEVLADLEGVVDERDTYQRILEVLYFHWLLHPNYCKLLLLQQRQ